LRTIPLAGRQYFATPATRRIGAQVVCRIGVAAADGEEEIKMNKSDLTIGAVVDLKPVPLPRKEVVEGRYVRLAPVDPARHAEDLFSLSRDNPEIWTYLGYGPFADLSVFRAWLTERAAQTDPLFVTIVDTATGRASGMASYLRMTPTDGVIEIGHIWFVPAIQRTRQATEAIFLLMREAFALGYRRLEWKCNALNAPSRRAALRFGFTFEGIFRQHMIIKGRNRDTAWFAMMDHEWPAVRAGFERWLARDNFDEAGRQRTPLVTAAAR
jgi:RimJ/RimL family protein N-acetyltransferase